MRYLIDTSTLLEAGASNALRLIEDHAQVSELVVHERVLAELDGLSDGSSKRARAARTAASLSRQTLKVVQEPSEYTHVDDVVLDVAGREGYGIVSQDRALIERAKDRGIPTLTLKRSRKIGD